MSDLNREQKRDYARTLYIGDRSIAQKEVAERVGVSVQTMCKWVKDGQWDELRTSLLISKEHELARLYKQLEQINDYAESHEDGKRFLSSKDADALSKIASAIRKMETDMNIADKMSVGREFLAFARQTVSFEDSKMIGKVFDSYIQTFRKG